MFLMLHVPLYAFLVRSVSFYPLHGVSCNVIRATRYLLSCYTIKFQVSAYLVT